MKKILLAVCTVVMALGLSVGNAEAARLGGGKSVELKIDVAKLRAAGGGFGYFCSFPGHAHGMRGQINLVQPAA